jgi:hypothetical protein
VTDVRPERIEFADAILYLGFWPVQHGPISADAYTDTDVTSGPVYLGADDAKRVEIK